MKTKLVTTICHLSLCAAAFAQTSTLTINGVTGKINAPASATPFFDVLNVAGTPVPLLTTPQRYGAIADGSSHPVSEWLTGGAHDRGYANLAAIQSDYPHVTALTDEVDWAATQKAANMQRAVYLPAGDYMLGQHRIESRYDGQIFQGEGATGLVGSGHYTTLRAGAGVDGIAAIAAEHKPAMSQRDRALSGSGGHGVCGERDGVTAVHRLAIGFVLRIERHGRAAAWNGIVDPRCGAAIDHVAADRRRTDRHLEDLSR